MTTATVPEGQVATGENEASLDRSALSGAAWSGGAKWTTQLLSWASTILVARILMPSDYGLVMMASVFLGIVAMLSEFGIGSTVVTLRELKRDELRQLNGFSVLLGVGGSILAVLAAYPLGLFFRAPDLPPVLAVLGLTFFITSLQTVPAALLRREMRFRSLAMIDVARGVLMPVATLVAALLGLRYWSLVVGTLVGATVAAAMTIAARRESFSWPRLSRLGHGLRFSRDVLIGRLGWVVYSNGDFAVAARQLGQGAAGVYTLAWTLGTSPIEKISILINDVTPSLFSAVQHDRAALRRYFLNLTELLCLATFPAAIGLALVSEDLVTVLLGPKWEGTGGPLALLALYSGARAVTQLFGHLFTATRQTQFAMWTSLALAVALVAGFIIGSRWGGVGIAAAWLVVHPAFSVYSFTRVRSAIDARGRDYLRSLRLGLDGSVAMAAAILAFQWFLAAEWPAGPRLGVAILLGAAVFGCVTWFAHGVRLRQIIAWLKRVRRGETAAL
jgi:O-antigen/teichoic acid export membrane protein